MKNKELCLIVYYNRNWDVGSSGMFHLPDLLIWDCFGFGLVLGGLGVGLGFDKNSLAEN